MSWSGENPVGVLAARRGRREEAAVRRTVLGMAGGTLVLAHALAALEGIPVLRGLWPFWSEAANILVVSLVLALLVAVPLDQARRDAALLRALRNGSCLPEILGTRLGAAELCDGLARHSLERGVGTALVGPLVILLGGPLLPTPSLLVVPLVALAWLVALALVQVAAAYILQVGAAWAGRDGRLGAGGDVRVAAAVLPLPAALLLRTPLAHGLELALALGATVVLSRAGAIAGVRAALHPTPPPARRPRKPHGPWGEGNPFVLRSRVVGRPALVELLPFLLLVVAPGAVLAALKGPGPGCWWMLLAAVPLQTWRSAATAFEAVARETSSVRLESLHLTALTAGEFAGGMASSAWRPRVIEVALLAPFVLAAAWRCGLPLPEIVGFLVALAALTFAGAQVGVLAALERGTGDGRRDLALHAAALMGMVALAVVQVSADVTAGQWRYAVSESRAILAITGLYVPLVAASAALLLRSQTLRALTHSPGTPGFSPPPCGARAGRE